MKRGIQENVGGGGDGERVALHSRLKRNKMENPPCLCFIGDKTDLALSSPIAVLRLGREGGEMHIS